MPNTLQFRTPRVIFALIVREMMTTYGRSAGGYIWAFLEPLLGIALLTLVFALVMRSPPMGTSFALFYACGIIPFMTYMTVQQKIAQSIGFSRQLLVYPRVTFFDAVAARFVLNGITELVVAYVLLSGILIFTGWRAMLDFGEIAMSLGLALLVGLGVGSLNCVLFALYPTWARVWAIGNRPMFILSGIFFMYEDVPPAFQKILWWNPLMHLVGLMRGGVYPTYINDYVSVPYILVWILVPGTLGLFFLRRYHRKILNEL